MQFIESKQVFHLNGQGAETCGERQKIKKVREIGYKLHYPQCVTKQSCQGSSSLLP